MLLVLRLPEIIWRLPGLPQSFQIVLELSDESQKLMTSESFGFRLLHALYICFAIEDTAPRTLLLYVTFMQYTSLKVTRSAHA